MSWFRRRNYEPPTEPCRHFWIKTAEDVVDHSCSSLHEHLVTYIYCYCPRCDTRNKVSELEWKIRSNECMIRESWSEMQLKDQLFTDWFNFRLKEWEESKSK